jgi:hypothetical protein
MQDFIAAVVLLCQLFSARLQDRVNHSYGMHYIRSVRSYFSRLVRAHIYHWKHAQHKYRKEERQVSALTPLSLRTYGASPTGRLNVPALPPMQNFPLRWENTDAVLADPAWILELQTRLAAAKITLKGPENDQESSHMGRDTDPDGAYDRPTESVHSRQGWGNNRGYARQNRRGGLQRTSERVQARTATLLDLVHADDFAFPVPQLRRLPQPAR